MIKYDNISYSMTKIFLRNVTVQPVFRIVSAITISKPIYGIKLDILYH